MTTSRRDFIRRSASAALLAGAGASTLLARGTSTTGDTGGPPVPPATRENRPYHRATPMNILILGGTAFLGPEVVAAARARGHTITLFNRGRTNPGLFPDAEQLRGDRDPGKGDGLRALEGRRWDAVIDTSAYVPRIARASAELLRDNVKRYLIISTVSVYADHSTPGADAAAPVATTPDPTVETIGGGTYGPLKALCEEEVRRAYGARATVVRPGLIVGPGDPTGRFTYWPVRVWRGGEVLAPGTPADPIQMIDVRDLAEWIVKLLEDCTPGTFDALGPQSGLTMGKVLDACLTAARGAGGPAGAGDAAPRAELTWVPADFLAAREILPWVDLPLWLPPEGESGGMHRRDVSTSIAAGLAFRHPDETAATTLSWWRGLAGDDPKRTLAGLASHREDAALRAWRERRGG